MKINSTTPHAMNRLDGAEYMSSKNWAREVRRNETELPPEPEVNVFGRTLKKETEKDRRAQQIKVAKIREWIRSQEK